MGMNGRLAVVTGAARGIGLGIAERLAALGHHLVLIDIDQQKARAAARDLVAKGWSAEGLDCDVSDWDTVRACVTGIDKANGRIDILVNNAGGSISHGGRALDIEDISIEEWNRVVSVNLGGAFLMCKACLPVMKRRQWGRIVNISSMGGRTRSLLSGAAYGASKAGLIGFTRVLAGEGGPHGITANCIAPGRVETAQSQAFDDANSFAASIPAGRIGQVADIAAGVAYLVSDEASYVTGAILDINGGCHMP